MFIWHSHLNCGQAPMFSVNSDPAEQRAYSGKLIDSLLLATEVIANKKSMQELLMDDPFVWAAPAWSQNLKKI